MFNRERTGPLNEGFNPPKTTQPDHDKRGYNPPKTAQPKPSDPKPNTK